MLHPTRTAAAFAVALLIAAAPALAHASEADDLALLSSLSEHISETDTPPASDGTGGRVPTDQRAIRSNSVPLTLTASELPEQFDLRDVQGTSYVTPVVNQGYANSCWAFADLGSLESSLIMQGKATTQVAELSKRFLVYFMHTPLSQTAAAALGMPNQAGEGTYVFSSSPYAPFMIGEGQYSSLFAIPTLGGVPSEQTAPWRSDEGYLLFDEQGSLWSPLGTWSLSDALCADLSNRVTSLDQGIMLPTPMEQQADGTATFNETYANQLKSTIMNVGAISIGLRMPEPGDSPDFYNPTTGAQYFDEPLNLNHGVVIVGWDDTYSRENFAITPPADGAWLCKNSWGSTTSAEGHQSTWGVEGSGYFWLSYYDETFTEATSFVAGDPVNPARDVLLQHDFANSDTSYVYNTPISIANTFTAPHDMMLTDTSLYAEMGMCDATIEVYLLDEQATNPTDGTLLLHQKETVARPSYQTIELDKPLTIREGERFSIVQTLHAIDVEGIRFAPGDDIWLFPVEVTFQQDFAELYGRGYYSKTVINSGETYLRLTDTPGWEDNTWLDAVALHEHPEAIDANVEFGNAQIKAFGEKVDLDDDEETGDDPEQQPDDDQGDTGDDSQGGGQGESDDGQGESDDGQGETDDGHESDDGASDGDNGQGGNQTDPDGNEPGEHDPNASDDNINDAGGTEPRKKASDDAAASTLTETDDPAAWALPLTLCGAALTLGAVVVRRS